MAGRWRPLALMDGGAVGSFSQRAVERAAPCPLHLDADAAFVRDDRVVGFDERLLVVAFIIALPSGRSLELCRFRGDGELILELARPPLALEIERDVRRSLSTSTRSSDGFRRPLGGAPSTIAGAARSDSSPSAEKARC